MKLKWQVADVPVGRYRSFEKRGWPMAYYPDGKVAARVTCADEYIPARVRTGEHSPLTISVVRYSRTPEEKSREGAWRWCTLKARAPNLVEAKSIAEQFLNSYPEFKGEE